MSHISPHALGDTAQHSADTLAALNALISDLTATFGAVRDIAVGTLAERDAEGFGTPNRFWYTTDEQNLYRDTGSAWEALQVTPDLHAASHTDGTDDIQDAGAAQKGLVNTAAQTFAGLKTFTTPPRASTLNTGDEIITTDTDGDLQESGVKVETAPAGGSGFTLVEYSSDPVNPPAGFLWIQNVAGVRRLRYYDGSAYHYVDM